MYIILFCTYSPVCIVSTNNAVNKFRSKLRSISAYNHSTLHLPTYNTNDISYNKPIELCVSLF